MQDQLCSAYGGVTFIEIVDYPRAVVSRLDLAADSLQELERRLALVYLGRPHSSSAVHETVMRALMRLGPDCAPLEALRAAALINNVDAAVARCAPANAPASNNRADVHGIAVRRTR